MTRTEIKKWLRSYSKIKSEREGILTQIRSLENDRDESQLRSPMLTGMPRSGKLSDPTAEAAERYEAIVARYEQKAAELLCRLEAIERALDYLPPDEADVLRRYYIAGLPWYKVAAQTARSERLCYALASRGISTLAEIVQFSAV